MQNDKSPVIKPYHQLQIDLLPQSLDELIPDGHPVRMVNKVIEEIDISSLIAKYKGGGASSYDPKCC